MSDNTSEANKALVLEAFDTLFNRRDYASAERFWSPRYIQHSAHIAPGREGLFDLIRAAPATLRYEHGLILAEGGCGDYCGARMQGEGIEPRIIWLCHADMLSCYLACEYCCVLINP